MNSKSILFDGRRRLTRVALPLLTVLFSLMLATPAQASASTVTTSTEFPISLTVFIPCAGPDNWRQVSGNGCNSVRLQRYSWWHDCVHRCEQLPYHWQWAREQLPGA